MIPDEYKPWVFLLWTAMAVVGIASGNTLLEAFKNIGIVTAVIVGGIILYVSNVNAKANDPITKINTWLDQIDEKLARINTNILSIKGRQKP